MKKTPIKLGIIGCGNVVEKLHLPACRSLGSVEVVYVCDLQPAKAARLAAQFKIPNHTVQYQDFFGKVDAVLIATPHSTHTAIALDCFNRGIHALCEKPMAVTAKEAETMMKAAEQKRCHLAVGMVRRCWPSVMQMQMALQSGALGNLQSFAIEEGAGMSWGEDSYFLFNKHQSGGGILMSVGIHALDLVTYLMGESVKVESYEDDDMGTGWEANAWLALKAGPVSGRMEVSYIQQKPFRFRVTGTKGSAEMIGANRICFYDTDGRIVSSNNVYHQEKHPADPLEIMAEDFREQMHRFCASLQEEKNIRYVTAREALPAIKIIESCYLTKKNRRLPNSEALYLENLLKPEVRTESRKTVLVTGATGFAGCRTVERLVAKGYKVKALMHTLNRPSIPRLARMGHVEMVQGELLASESLTKAVAGVDGVIHCAYGHSGNAAEQYKVTVEGTKNLLSAAKQSGAKRFVHISTTSVFGLQPAAGTQDDSPYNHSGGKYVYIDGKIDAEKAVLAAHSAGLPSVIIRPVAIYGPYSDTWAVRVAEELKEGRVLLPQGEYFCNIVYIDNLIDVFLLALESDKAAGQAFNIVDDKDPLTWRDFYKTYAALLNLEERVGKKPAKELLEIARREDRRRRLTLSKITLKGLSSPEIRSFVSASKPYQFFYNSMPKLMEKMKKRVDTSAAAYHINSKEEPKIKDVILNEVWLQQYSGMCRFTSQKAQRVLGYRQQITFNKGAELTVSWLKYER